MKNTPKSIFLNIAEWESDEEDFKELIEVRWCEDKINETDIEYVHLDSLQSNPSEFGMVKKETADQLAEALRGALPCLEYLFADKAALAQTALTNYEQGKGDDGSELSIWLQSQIKHLSQVEGEVVKVSEYGSGLSIKFKNGNHYTLGISKQCLASMD